ncbi:hypothetical protein RchiOBHm_Chr4g0406821 [Rosa chinensis]|uniref:Uncharacterized protein n=1 Tax=Rosa chinensis TaxID=74649 RepID=A0A2P6QUE6_ROSCH|nr:hypothetical protein RchiOBHm_Chr4g0406821 [Rosa chinensis]
MALMFLLEGEIQNYIYIFYIYLSMNLSMQKFSNCADSQEFLMVYLTGKVNPATWFANQRGSHVFQISFWYLISVTCNIQRYMSCKGTCLASIGSDQPAEVVDDAPEHLNPGACLYSQTQSMLSCYGSHQHTRRLCPCA